MDINIDSQIVIQTAAQWAADTDVYSEKRILVTSDVYYTGTDQRKFKLANGVDTWSNLDYMPLGGSTTWGGITGTLSNQTDLQNALNAKENSITAGTTAQYWRGDKTFQTLDKTAVGLGNADNTSDANKPISTATQIALDNKQDLDSDLTSIAGLTPSNDDIIQRKAGSWVNRTLAQLWTDLKDLTVTLTNKTLSVGSNSITGTASRVAQFGAGGSLEASSVTNTQLSYLDATSSIQTQLNRLPFWIAGHNSISPADSITYAIGVFFSIVPQPASWGGASSWKFPFAHTITKVVVVTRYAVAGSNEASALSLRNQTTTTDNAIGNLDYSLVSYVSASGFVQEFTVSISVNNTDYYWLKEVTPAWGTNPTNVAKTIYFY